MSGRGPIWERTARQTRAEVEEEIGFHVDVRAAELDAGRVDRRCGVDLRGWARHRGLIHDLPRTAQ